MVAEYRRQAILDLAREQAELSVEDIARRFHVSRETVRRDLTALHKRGLLERVHGGAVSTQIGWEANYQERLSSNADAKRSIALAAASQFKPNDTIMVDTGTTTSILAVALASLPQLTIITNSLIVAGRLAASPSNHRVHLLGGDLHGTGHQTLGSVCLEQISRYRADHAVISCGAIHDKGGIMDFDLEDAMVARAMIEQSQKLTVIADASKFNKVAMAKVCDLHVIDWLVCDLQLPPQMAAALEESQVKVTVTESD